MLNVSLNVHNLLGFATVGGVIWYLVDRFILHPWIWNFIGKIILWKWDAKTKQELDHVNNKVPKFIGKIVYHGVQETFWYYYFAIYFTEWMDKWNWAVYTLPQKNEGPEYEAIVPLYLMYFSFTIFSFLKDIAKIKHLDFAQFMFQLHHVLAISLTYGSLCTGFWRAGFLTTFTHQPADVILYACKIYHSKFDLGSGNKYGVVVTVGVLNFGWFYSRLYLYGILVFSLCVMIKDNFVSAETFNLMGILLLIGSILMYVLQVIWQGAILKYAVSKVVTGNLKVDDPWHNQKKKEFKKEN